MATSVLNPEAASGVSGSWTWFRVGGYCLLTVAVTATGVAVTTSNTGQYQSAEIDTGIYLPSWVTGIVSVAGTAGSGSQAAGVRLHRVTLWNTGVTLKYMLAANTSISSANFPFTALVIGTC